MIDAPQIERSAAVEAAREAVMEAVQSYGSTKQAFGQAYEGERAEAKERHGKRLEPCWDAVLAALDAFGGACRAERVPSVDVVEAVERIMEAAKHYADTRELPKEAIERPQRWAALRTIARQELAACRAEGVADALEKMATDVENLPHTERIT